MTKREINEVFLSELSFDEELRPSDRGNSRSMVIGPTFEGRILEIGVEYFEDENHEHIFHAMDAGKRFTMEFKRRIR